MDHSDPLERATQTREIGPTWDDQQFREAREEDLRQRTSDARSAVVAALSCLLLAALLTSGKIVEIAERQEFGATRDRQVDMAEGLDRVANFLSLNRPYDAIRDVRGSGDDAAVRIDSIDQVAEELGLDPDVGIGDAGGAAGGGTSGDEPGALADPGLAGPTTDDGGQASEDDTVDPATTGPPTTTTLASIFPLRSVTAAEPLTVFVGGDSQSEYLAQAIATESDLPLAVEVQHEISTSLARPDYFNWPARLAEVAANQDPDAVVFFIGANDYQDMADADGNRLVVGSFEWANEWSRRLAITFDILERDGRHVFWVTQPPMREGGLDDGIGQINQIAASVIAEREWVSAVDIWELFGGTSGFSERVVHPDGRETRARIDDGVHLTRDAASWVAEMVFGQFQQAWEFPAG